MSIKTILVPVSNGTGGFSAIKSAFLVARAFESHVVGLHLVPPGQVARAEDLLLSRAVAAPLGRDVLQMLEDSEQEECREARESRRLFLEVSQRAGAAGLETGERPGPVSTASGPRCPSAAFKQVVAEGPEVIASFGRVVDLIVLQQPKSDPGHGLRKTLRAALFHSGRPVLVAPDRPPVSVGRRLLIAWNGSPLSARAAAISRQYFRQADAVGILTVDVGARQGASAYDLAAYMAWHGVRPSVIEVSRSRRRLGDVILAEARNFRADLLVMGAYAQSPFRESLTQGVTNHVLSHAELPMLMTH